MVKTKKLYAAYGSNMNIEQMAHRCPKARIVGKAVLQDFKLTFRGVYKGVANIEPCMGREVPIVIWSITDECENALDVYEGYPRLYKKKTLEVTMDNKPTKVMAYVMTKEYCNLPSLPTEYYLNVIARGYSDNDIDLKTLNNAYSECLKEVEGE